jgi:hypothetical protein
METGNIGQMGPKNFGGVVHELKANHNKETDGPFGQSVSALAKAKHGPLPTPPVEASTPVSGDDSVDIQATPLQTATVAVFNAVNDTFNSNLALSSQPTGEQAVETELVREELIAEEIVETSATETPTGQTEPTTSLTELAIEEASQEIVSLTTGLFDAETDQIDDFYGSLSTAVEVGFQDGLSSFSSTEDVDQILELYEQVQHGIDTFYQEQSGSESGRVWQDLSVAQVVEETEEVIAAPADTAISDNTDTPSETVPQPLPEYAQIQSLLDTTSPEGLSVEA